ncbi:MAG: ATP-binding protein [Clostridia bacterium]|nr:ATP-binding protein [Clostridia bacterium]
MHRIVSRLLLFGDLGRDSILVRLADIFRDWEEAACPKETLIRRTYDEVKRLLDLGTLYGFDENLWHNYLTFLLMTNENSFTLTSERLGASEGSVNLFALQDFALFGRLFAFDFAPFEESLGIDCFRVLTHYRAIPKRERLYYRSVSERVRRLSRELESAKTAEEMFSLMTAHYREWGVGMFGLNRAFRLQEDASGWDLVPINNTDAVRLSDLVGYELQKQQLRENTEAFLEGRSCNNMLLYGDAGTGKSTSVKALLNEYGDRGLRMIELYKHQFDRLSEVIARVKVRNYRFMIFIDDLSFEEHEVEYKFLKAVIEGGVETRPDNVLICATSNRRHLIRETWSDRNDMEFQNDLHRSDTMEEKLSLAARFGCSVCFSTPDRQQYRDIVLGIAGRTPGFEYDPEQLLYLADRWEIRHGGVSGRTAQQFINYMAGKKEE